MDLDFYRLKRDAFLLTPDPRLLHLSEPHRNAILAFNRAVMQRKGFMVLTGPTGSGKTTIINFVLAWFSRLPAVSSALIVNPVLTRDELLEAILEEFDIPCDSESKPKRLHALQDRLLEIRRKGGTAVLIVDEAHLMTPELLEEIRLLGNMDTFDDKLLQIILSGQPELASVLLDNKLKALRQRVTVVAELRSLTRDETSQYIGERLRLAGLQSPSPFSAASMTEVHRCTRGIPRLINVLCDQALQLGYAAKARLIDPEMIFEAAGKLSVLRSAPTGLSSREHGSGPVLARIPTPQRVGAGIRG